MSTPLIATGALISQSWKQFFKNWKSYFSVALWFLPGLFLISIASYLSTIRSLNWALLVLLGTLLLVYPSIRLLKYALLKDHDEKTPSAISISWAVVLSTLWIGLLTALAVGAGFILLVIPGIWLAISLSYAQLILLEDGKRGTTAIKESMALVKNRWWSTFWRMIATSFVFGIVQMIVNIFVSILIGALFGVVFALLIRAGNLTALTPTVTWTIRSLAILIQSLVSIFWIPLAMVWQVKLFHSLKASR